MRLHGNGREHNPEKAKISCASTAFTIVHEDTMNEKSVLPTLLKLQKKERTLCSKIMFSWGNFNKFHQLCLAKLAHLATLMKVTYFVLTNTVHHMTFIIQKTMSYFLENPRMIFSSLVKVILVFNSKILDRGHTTILVLIWIDMFVDYIKPLDFTNWSRSHGDSETVKNKMKMQTK